MPLFTARKSFVVFGASGVAVSHTGNTSETALATIAIPAGAIGANGALRITAHWSWTNSVNNKTPRVRLGGLAGTEIWAAVQASTGAGNVQRTVQNRNSQASQVSFPSGNGGSYGAITALTTMTVNTASAQDLVFSGQLTSAGETVTLESYLVELLYQG